MYLWGRPAVIGKVNCVQSQVLPFSTVYTTTKVPFIILAQPYDNLFITLYTICTSMPVEGKKVKVISCFLAHIFITCTKNEENDLLVKIWLCHTCPSGEKPNEAWKLYRFVAGRETQTGMEVI